MSHNKQVLVNVARKLSDHLNSVEGENEKVLLSYEKLDGNEGVQDLKLARDWLETMPRLRELILGGYARTLDDEVTIASSWKNYASERNVRFNEMEYHLPRENGIRALQISATARPLKTMSSQ